jgi:UDP-glucose 4-epimerase
MIEGDINDAKKLQEGMQGVDAVIHMASFTSVEESVKSPLKYMQNNVLGAATVLEAMREVGVKKIVFSSSATVYGTPKTLPITEDLPLSAANPYGASKIAVEVLCESFAKTDDFDVIILRYFNPYGPGEDHIPETHAIPNFIKPALAKEKIPLYWKGEQVRDFIYVEDLAAAHIAVLPLSGYNVFNVGTKSGTKIIDVVNELSDIFGYKIEVEDKGDRAGDVMATYASSEKLTEATGWTTKVSLKEGLAKTVEYFKSRAGN